MSRFAPSPSRHLAAMVIIALLLAASGPLTTAWSGDGAAWAQVTKQRRLAILPLSQRKGASYIRVADIEKQLRAATAQRLQLLPSAVVEKSVDHSVKRVEKRAYTAADRAIDVANAQLRRGKSLTNEGAVSHKALAAFKSAIVGYERHFAALADFNNLFDAYKQAVLNAFKLNERTLAKELLTRVLVLQPSFVVDKRFASEDLQRWIEANRATLAKRGRGAIVVRSSAAGATVYIDGVKLGDAPQTRDGLTPGRHHLQVKKEGFVYWGRSVLVGDGATREVQAELVPLEGHARERAKPVTADEIKAFAAAGNLHKRTVRDKTRIFADQLQVDGLVYGVAARVEESIELHLFLYSARVDRIAALETVVLSSSHGDVQSKASTAASAIAKALEVFPTSQQVKKRPKVYRLGTDASLAKQPGSVLAGTHTDPNKYKRFLEEKRAKKKETKLTSTWWFWASIGTAVVTSGVVTAMMLEPQPAPAKTFTIGATMPKAP